jgi:hypothetical protein
MEKLVESLTKRVEALETRVEALETHPVKPKYEKPVDDGKVEMNIYKKGILVTGSTFAIKNTLSENGGKWNKALGGWMFTKSHLDEVIEAIEADGVNLVIGDGVKESV